MSYLSEKVSYLKGLAEGMKLKEDTNEGKLLKAIIEALEDTADAIGEIVDIQDDMQLQLDDVDDDLAALEEEVYDNDGCGCGCGCGDDCDCDCDCGCDCGCGDDDFEEFEVECPKCGEVICLDADSIEDDEDEITCPNCGEKFDILCDEDSCDCCK